MNVNPLKLGNVAPDNDFEKNLEKGLLKLAEQVREILNGGLRFEDNFSIELKTITTHATPDTETAYTHTLKRVPIGFIVYDRNKAGILYAGSSANTATTIYIRSNVASVTAKILII